MRVPPRRILSALMLVTGVDRRGRRWFAALLAIVVIGFSSRIVGTGYARLPGAGASTIAVRLPATPASALSTSSSPMDQHLQRPASCRSLSQLAGSCKASTRTITAGSSLNLGEKPVAALDFITSSNNADSAGWATLSPTATQARASSRISSSGTASARRFRRTRK